MQKNTKPIHASGNYVFMVNAICRIRIVWLMPILIFAVTMSGCTAQKEVDRIDIIYAHSTLTEIEVIETPQQNEMESTTPIMLKEQAISHTEEYKTYITIRGEQFCTSLTEIWLLGFTLINEDVEPLRHMTNLTNLSLGMSSGGGRLWVETPAQLPYTGITDLSFLEGLTNLTRLDLSGHRITDLSPLSGLVNLTSLDLTANNIYDVTPLSNLTNLVGLGLGGNPIADIAPLANLTNLERLSLCGIITDTTFSLEPLANLTNLTDLSIESRQIKDITPLASLENLWRLELHDNQIDDLTPLADLEFLEFLVLSDNQISDLTPLTGLEFLEFLVLSDNLVSNLASLADMSNLESLWLFNNPITDWSPLEHIQGVMGRP